MLHEIVVLPSIVLTDTDAVIRRKERSNPVVARVLGREVVQGVETVWLDRCVHHRGEDAFEEGWNVSGAVSTVLRRRTQQ